MFLPTATPAVFAVAEVEDVLDLWRDVGFGFFEGIVARQG